LQTAPPSRRAAVTDDRSLGGVATPPPHLRHRPASHRCTSGRRRYFWICSPPQCRLQVESVRGKSTASGAIQTLSGRSVTDQPATFTAGLPSLTPVLHVSSNAVRMTCRSNLVFSPRSGGTPSVLLSNLVLSPRSGGTPSVLLSSLVLSPRSSGTPSVLQLHELQSSSQCRAGFSRQASRPCGASAECSSIAVQIQTEAILHSLLIFPVFLLSRVLPQKCINEEPSGAQLLFRGRHIVWHDGHAVSLAEDFPVVLHRYLALNIFCLQHVHACSVLVVRHNPLETLAPIVGEHATVPRSSALSLPDDQPLPGASP